MKAIRKIISWIKDYWLFLVLLPLGIIVWYFLKIKLSHRNIAPILKKTFKIEKNYQDAYDKVLFRYRTERATLQAKEKLALEKIEKKFKKKYDRLKVNHDERIKILNELYGE